MDKGVEQVGRLTFLQRFFNRQLSTYLTTSFISLSRYIFWIGVYWELSMLIIIIINWPVMSSKLTLCQNINA